LASGYYGGRSTQLAMASLLATAAGVPAGYYGGRSTQLAMASLLDAAASVPAGEAARCMLCWVFDDVPCLRFHINSIACCLIIVTQSTKGLFGFKQLKFSD
jgi:ABC-type dipeptide/oligopeptide/nickel transport system permease subunit